LTAFPPTVPFSAIDSFEFWIELGKLGEKPLRKRRLEKTT
jgi:hypothetical protein